MDLVGVRAEGHGYVLLSVALLDEYARHVEAVVAFVESVGGLMIQFKVTSFTLSPPFYPLLFPLITLDAFASTGAAFIAKAHHLFKKKLAFYYCFLVDLP